MIELDRSDKKMVLKLVFYGPALSGKTTNLLRLHDLLSEQGRGNLMVLELLNMARSRGMKTLIEDGIEKVGLGETTLEELLRVIGTQTRHERKCEDCERLIDAKFLFCPYCGTFKQNFCKQCRMPLDEDWRVCPFCGDGRFGR